MSTAQRPPPRHFSMLREFHLADAFTLANAACGVAGVLMAMRFLVTKDTGDLLVGAAFAPAALVFDVLDGRIARWRHTSSALGRELDSLADVISFGVAPAALAFASGLMGAWDALVLLYFVCCGVSRLARYNVTAESLSDGGDKVAYFEGTPIPTSVLLSAVLAFAAWQGRIGASIYGSVWLIGGAALHPLVLLFALSGTLMVSKTLRIPKL
ncbi:MAG: CDP-alcohol phosphatidyltransferase family protein [Caldimonas sp.]|nr:CDP-alcohol phosphatidyltransferase family protein [Pseudomonadota bacterium]